MCAMFFQRQGPFDILLLKGGFGQNCSLSIRRTSVRSYIKDRKRCQVSLDHSSNPTNSSYLTRPRIESAAGVDLSIGASALSPLSYQILIYPSHIRSPNINRKKNIRFAPNRLPLPHRAHNSVVVIYRYFVLGIFWKIRLLCRLRLNICHPFVDTFLFPLLYYSTAVPFIIQCHRCCIIAFWLYRSIKIVVCTTTTAVILHVHHIYSA